MLAVGFRVVLTRSIVGRRELANPNDDVLKYIQLMLPSSAAAVSRDDIRAVVDEIFSRPHLCNYNKRLAVFRK